MLTAHAQKCRAGSTTSLALRTRTSLCAIVYCSHVQGLSGHAHPDQGVGGGHGAALGGEDGTGVPELYVAGHITGGQDNFASSVHGPRRHDPILMGGGDHKAVPVAHPLAVSQGQVPIIAPGHDDVAHPGYRPIG
jgi:hypothetical protein